MFLYYVPQTCIVGRYAWFPARNEERPCKARYKNAVADARNNKLYSARGDGS